MSFTYSVLWGFATDCTPGAEDTRYWSREAQKGSVINSPPCKWCCLAPFTLTFQHSMWRKPPDSAEGGRAIRPLITNQSLLLLPELVTEHRWQTKQWLCPIIELFFRRKDDVFSIFHSLRKCTYCFKHQVAQNRNVSFSSVLYCEHWIRQIWFDLGTQPKYQWYCSTWNMEGAHSLN